MRVEDLDSTVCAISPSKLRKDFGLVVAGLDADNKKLFTGYAMRWERNALRSIVPTIKTLQKQLGFTHIIMDQQIGQHFIESLKRAELNVKVISTAKNVKNADEIENLEVLDWVEMSQLFVTFKNNHQIRFPENNSLKPLEDQVPIFAEHITEAGAAAYYATGKEPDDLIKSLVLCAFSYRKELTDGNEISVVCGPIQGKRKRAPRVEYIGNSGFVW